jgi:prephenate dehydrogenase
MAQISITILGLDRASTSIGLALRRYMQGGGAHNFDIVGYEPNQREIERNARTTGAVDRTERTVPLAVKDRDLIIMAMPYEETRRTYQAMGSHLRDGAVIIDLSPLKRPSMQWAQEYLTPQQHWIGATPLINPAYLFQVDQGAAQAKADLFDQGSLILTPSATCAKEAVDLAFSFASILGSRPRFLDPLEHDTFLGLTEGLPALLGVALFAQVQSNPAWHDLQWFTNSTFGTLTRPLFDTHPDALREEWLGNRDMLTRALDEMITTLQSVRQVIAANDRDAVDALLEKTSRGYEEWINHRYRGDWDAAATEMPRVEPGGTIMGALLGTRLANRLFGKKDEK